MSEQLTITGTPKVGATISTNASADAHVGWCLDGNGSSWCQMVATGHDYTIPAAAANVKGIRAVAWGANLGEPLGISELFGPIAAAPSTPGGTPVPTPPAVANVGFHLIANASEPSIPNVAATAAREQYVTLEPWSPFVKAMIEAGNKGVLCYVNAASVTTGEATDGLYDAVPESTPEAENWFLLDSDGNKITLDGYDWRIMVDPANPAFQQAFIAECEQIGAATGCAGFMCDNSDNTPAGTARPAKYPTDAEYQAAWTSFYTVVAPALEAKGYLVVPNVGNDVANVAQAVKLMSLTSGIMSEKFLMFAEPGEPAIYRDPADAEAQLAEAISAGAQGKILLATCDSIATDTRAATYGLVGVMLGATSARQAMMLAVNYAEEVWLPLYSTALGLGAATGAYQTLKQGVYSRTFARGWVGLNVTTSAQIINGVSVAAQSGIIVPS